jgi:hypothetical protein
VASLPGELIRERFGMTGLSSVMSRTMLVSCLADLGAFDEELRGEQKRCGWPRRSIIPSA